jgi:hypothetical protein
MKSLHDYRGELRAAGRRLWRRERDTGRLQRALRAQYRAKRTAYFDELSRRGLPLSVEAYEAALAGRLKPRRVYAGEWR